MNLYYENHLGKRIHFYRSPYILTNHSFFDWLLSFTTVNNKTSGYVFKPSEADFTVRLMPLAKTQNLREAMFAELYDEMVEVFSADASEPGKLWTDGGEYLSCRVISSKKSKWNIPRDVTVVCRISVDSPTWKKPEAYEISFTEETEYGYLDYPHGYNYDYKGTLLGYTELTNDSTEASDYIMTISGPITNPKVVVNGIDVGANVSVGSTERLVIDTAEQTVYIYGPGISKNVFNKRLKGTQSMFTKLPSGKVAVIWSGLFDFNFEIIRERREPSWT